MRLIGVLVILLCVPLIAGGQNCAVPFRPTYSVPYVAPVVVTPTVSQVFYDTPILFQFLAVTTPPPVTLVPGPAFVTQPALQSVPGVPPVTQPALPSAAPQLTIEQIREAVRDEIKAAVKAEVGAALRPRIEPKIEPNTGKLNLKTGEWTAPANAPNTPPPAALPPTTNVEPVEKPMPMPPAEDYAPKAAPDDSLTSKVAQIATTHCADCHTSPGRGKLDLFDVAGAFAPQVSRRAIYAAVKDDVMPRVPGKLSPDDKATIARWAGVN